MDIICSYDSSTGTFTVPPGGDGFYYFSTYLLVDNGEWARCEIRVNGLRLCTAYTDQGDSPGDEGQEACSGAYYASAGW